ncbi:hypothetical protein N2152v2_010299 [Parachlorella kessleri]
MTAAVVSAVSLDSDAKGASRCTSPSAGLEQAPQQTGPVPPGSHQSLAALYEAECRVREQAQQLAWELQQEYRAAVAELEEEQRQKGALLEALHRVQARYASLATLPAVRRSRVGSPEAQGHALSREPPEDGTDAVAGAALPADAAEPAFAAEQQSRATSEHLGEHSSTPPSQTGGAQAQGSEEGVDPAELGLTWEELRQAYEEAQALNVALEGEVERAQLERDAVLYRLEALEQSLSGLQLAAAPGTAAADDQPSAGPAATMPYAGQQQQQQQQGREPQDAAQQRYTSPLQQYYPLPEEPTYGSQGVAPFPWARASSSPGSLAVSPATTIGSSEAAVTPLERLPQAAPVGAGPAGDPGSSPAAFLSAAGDVQQHEQPQGFSAQAEEARHQGLPEVESAWHGSPVPSGAAGAGAAAPLAQLRQQVQELQVHAALLLEELSASQVVAGQLQARLVEERQDRQALEGRLAAAQRESRQADRQRVQGQQHIRELQDLVECAIEEAEGSRRLLQKVTAEGSTSGPKLKLGEIWTQLMQAEQRATSALRPSKSPKASDASGQQLLEVVTLLEESRGKDQRQGFNAVGDTVGKAARQSALRSRLAALNTRFSGSGSRTASPVRRGGAAPAAAASLAATPGAAPAGHAGLAQPAPALDDLESCSPSKAPTRAPSQLSRTPEPTRQHHWQQENEQQQQQQQQQRQKDQQQQPGSLLERAPELALPQPASPKVQLEKEDSASSTAGHSPVKPVLGLGQGLSPIRETATTAPWSSPHGIAVAGRKPLSPACRGTPTSAGQQAAASSAGSSPYAGSCSWPPTQPSPEQSPASRKSSSSTPSTSSRSDLSRRFGGSVAGSPSGWQAAEAESSQGEPASHNSPAQSGWKPSSLGLPQRLGGSSPPVRELLKKALEPCQASTSPPVTDAVPGGPPLMADWLTPVSSPPAAAAVAAVVPVAPAPSPASVSECWVFTAATGAAAGRAWVDRGVQTHEEEAWLWGPSSPGEQQGSHAAAQSSSPLHLAAGRLCYQPANGRPAEHGTASPLPYFHRDDGGLLLPRAHAAQWLARYWWVHWLLPPPLRLLCANVTLWLLRPFNLLLFNRLSAAAAASGTGLVGLALWLALLPMLRGQQAQHERHSGWWPPRPLSRAKAIGELVLHGLSSRQRRPPSRQA